MTTMLSTILDKNKYVLIASAATLDLIILCVAWEWFVSPLRPGGSWLILKAVPLIVMLPGIWRAKVYTMQWGTMLILIYTTEALVRISESGWNFWMALLELVFSVTIFISLLLYLKPIKAEAKAKAKMNPHTKQ
ncbi:COG3308 Predicted membrane protein [Burkholderiaceae bacterium]